ncbi:helix-turn-helix domain-containing protein [Alicyclobacillus mali (ex Roth et al. 2021)]|uniref:helix-turn-helix domain-containing protein n=1 Tax=Alicyclobacillus mali (ex Roth et al. 2021) TaxID=1123961 RepID=UPI003D6D7F16
MCLYVRELSPTEGNKLVRMARNGSNPVSVRRALVVLASAQRMKVPEIARLYHLFEEHVRHTIHAFNEKGFETLQPRYGGGRPRTLTDEEEQASLSWHKSHQRLWDCRLRPGH